MEIDTRKLEVLDEGRESAEELVTCCTGGANKARTA
jgi:putative radical SAM-modified peptide